MNSCTPSSRGFWNTCLPVNFDMVSPISKAGFTSMRSNPVSISVYMPPIDVPMMRSGCSSAAIAFSICSPSSGCSGMSRATTVALGISVRSICTVPDCADEPNPCTYISFLPRISSGYCFTN